MTYRKSGKVDVRKHPRRLEKGGLTIVEHHKRIYPPSTPRQPSKPKVKSTYERRLKDMDYKAAKRVFPWIEPNGDLDGDGARNKEDCHPFDKNRQDDEAKEEALNKLIERFGDLNFDLHYIDEVAEGRMKVEDVPYNKPCPKCSKVVPSGDFIGMDSEGNFVEIANIKTSKPLQDINKIMANPSKESKKQKEEDNRTWLTDGSNIWSGNPEDWKDSDSVWVAGGKDFEKYKKESKRKREKYVKEHGESYY